MSITRFFAAPVAYPVSAAWIAGVLTLVGVSAHWFALGAGITGFAVICILIILAITHRQLATMHNDLGVVHSLVNSQRTALAERIDSLTAALTIAGVTIPPDPEQAKVEAAMREVENQ